MYSSLLFIHSWARWIVLLGGLALMSKMYLGWAKKSKWGGYENGLIWAFSQLLGYQVLFGLGLYLGGSPYTKYLISHTHEALGSSLFSFWSIRHPLTMVLALITFQAGKHFSQKYANHQDRHRCFAITMSVTMLIVLTAIPWPTLTYGRSLFRWFL